MRAHALRRAPWPQLPRRAQRRTAGIRAPAHRLPARQRRPPRRLKLARSGGARRPAPDGRGLRARPGRPAEYEVDFITTREWLPETALAPASPFPAVTTEFGTFSSAHVARRCLERAIDEIEHDYLDQHRTPRSGHVRGLDTVLTALSGWSGLKRDALLRSFSEVIAEKDGQLIAGAAGPHPVILAAASTPQPAAAAIQAAAPIPGPGAAVLPFRHPGRNVMNGLGS